MTKIISVSSVAILLLCVPTIIGWSDELQTATIDSRETTSYELPFENRNGMAQKQIYSSESVNPSKNQLQSGRQVDPSGPTTLAARFKNSCSQEPIYLSVRIKDREGTWRTKGWWEIAYNETAYIGDSIKNYVYFYAENGNTSWQGDMAYKVAGNSFAYERESELDSDRYEKFSKVYIRKVVELKCN